MRLLDLLVVVCVVTGCVSPAAAATRALRNEISAGQTAALRDISRMERRETMVAQISRAATAGATRDTVGHATASDTRSGDDEFGHLDRKLRLFAATSRRRLAQALVPDGLRGMGAQRQAATATSLIRSAAAGQMSVRDAITASQEEPTTLAERAAAGPAQQQASRVSP